MKSENALVIWICRLVGPILSLLILIGIYGIYIAIFDPSDSNNMSSFENIAMNLFAFVFCLVLSGIGCVMTFYGYIPRTKEQMKDSYKAAGDSIKNGATAAAVVTAVVINEEIKKMERNKPITKGDLEDLERKMRRDREDRELDEKIRRYTE